MPSAHSPQREVPRSDAASVPAAVADALDAAAVELADRLRVTADKRRDWQQSLDNLLRDSNRPTTAPPAGSLGLDTLPVVGAAADRFAVGLRSATDSPDATSAFPPAAGLIDRALTAAVAHIHGRTARGLIQDFDRTFIAARSNLLDQLAPAEDGPADSSGDASLDTIVDRAAAVLQREDAGVAALRRLLDDFHDLFATLADASLRRTASAVLAHLVLILLSRLLRELIEHLAAPADPQATDRPFADAPMLRSKLRVVNRHRVRARGGHRPKSPVIATLERGRRVVCLEKRKKLVHAWWIGPHGRCHRGYLKAACLDHA